MEFQLNHFNVLIQRLSGYVQGRFKDFEELGGAGGGLRGTALWEVAITECFANIFNKKKTVKKLVLGVSCNSFLHPPLRTFGIFIVHVL